jgi:hypothetical protein
VKAFFSKLRTGSLNLLASTFAIILGIAGSALLCYGAYLIYKPAAFVVGGILVLYASYDASST